MGVSQVDVGVLSGGGRGHCPAPLPLLGQLPTRPQLSQWVKCSDRDIAAEGPLQLAKGNVTCLAKILQEPKNREWCSPLAHSGAAVVASQHSPCSSPYMNPSIYMCIYIYTYMCMYFEGGALSILQH